MARLQVDPSDNSLPYTQTQQPQSWKPEQAPEHALGHSPAAGSVAGTSMVLSAPQDAAGCRGISTSV